MVAIRVKHSIVNIIYFYGRGVINLSAENTITCCTINILPDHCYSHTSPHKNRKHFSDSISTQKLTKLFSQFSVFSGDHCRVDSKLF